MPGAALVWQKNSSLASDTKSPFEGSFVIVSVTCYCCCRTSRKKKLQDSNLRTISTAYTPDRIIFSKVPPELLLSLSPGWDKQDLIQSGMTQQHGGPQWFFSLPSKQNHYSPGKGAAQTQAPHHLAPPWNIPWKWLSLSSAASFAAGHERCRTASVWALSAWWMSPFAAQFPSPEDLILPQTGTKLRVSQRFLSECKLWKRC